MGRGGNGGMGGTTGTIKYGEMSTKKAIKSAISSCMAMMSPNKAVETTWRVHTLKC